MNHTDGFVFLDGAMGTMLRAAKPDFSGLPDLLCITAPEIVKSVHSAYYGAGSRIIYTNTFGATAEKLAGTGYTLDEVISAAVKTAKEAAPDADIALDMGPTGRLMYPNGSMSFNEAYEIYKSRIVCGDRAGADLLVFETMGDLAELRAGILAAKENSSLPIFATMTFDDNGRTFTGCSPEAFASLADALGVAALGVNCSLGPDKLVPIVKRISEVTNLPLIVKANAGLPSPIDGSYDLTPEKFARQMAAFAELGVKYIGGCCGTSPEYIKELAKVYSSLIPHNNNNPYRPLIGGAQRTLDIDKITVVGERLNPTGKKKLSAALLADDMDAVASIAIEQDKAGADVLDINVGVPGADEPQLMRKVVEKVISVTDLPLQIDSKNPEALEAGLRAYPGRAIINSVDGEEKNLLAVLPLAKKYGAAVIGLTLDENGIPETAEGRLAIAELILKNTERFDIRKSDVFIDCLTLSVSAEPTGPRETLKALSLVRDKLGLKTALGVSNVSFGLPKREIISSSFLTLALASGLTLPIINPCSRPMTDAVYSYRALTGLDESCMGYVNYIAGISDGDADPAKPEICAKSLFDSILIGDSISSKQSASDAISSGVASSDIIENELMPALDKVGEKFERGEYFLPQLMRSADAATAAVAVIREFESARGSAKPDGEKIILATVKGDIHDIGKNIVKTVLQNYGYDIIDLGRDVPPEKIVETAKSEKVRLVGLSALMTTTLPSMEATVKALRESGHECKIMVGGAVLTAEYAAKIGADYYSADAKRSADIAKEVFGATAGER